MPRDMASRMWVLAGSIPPITSTTMSISFASKPGTSAVISSLGIPGRALLASLTPTPTKTNGAPLLASKSSACSNMREATLEPTVPAPISAIRIGRT